MKNNYKLIYLNKHYSQQLKLYHDIKNNKDIPRNKFNYGIKFLLIFFIILQMNFLANKEKDLAISKKDNREVIRNHENKINRIHPKLFFNTTFLKNEMHTYGLYKIFKFPYISLILMIKRKNEINIIQIINQIKIVISQNFINIEILLYIEELKLKNYSLISKEFRNLIKDDRLKIYIKKINQTNFYDSAISLVKGLYTIFVDNINSVKYLNLNYLYNYTKGKIDNYFNLNISKDINLYLIKTKNLKNIIDNGKEILSFDMILNSIKSISIPIFNYIYIALCPNNYFTNLVYVAISSILSSKDITTYICFYLIIPSDFENKNKNFIDSLHEQYENFNITFIQMDNRYDKAYTDYRITKEAYYRFSLGELLPHLNKILYLDTDIIVYKDLINFYNLNFNGKMILGQPTYGNKNSQKKGFYKINTGILLLNLLEMRRHKFEKDVIEIIKKGKKLRYHDQTLLNDYFKEYIGIFPPEYHTRPWSNFKELEIFLNIIGRPFDKDYFYFAHKYPTIRHFLGRYKPRNDKINYIEDWWFYARKSKYYNNKAKSFKTAFSF